MVPTHLEPPRVEGAAIIRNEPVQARSAARLTTLLDAAASVIDEIGYERLTTAMVADRAGASIGTVYRYFPDRIAVLQSLAARNVERTSGVVLAEISSPGHPDWATALNAAFGRVVVAFRDEPGFASLRFGDVLDLRPVSGPFALQVFGDRVFSALVARFGVIDSEDARAAFAAVVISCDGLAARSFAEGPEAEHYLGLARTIARALLEPHWGPATP